MKLSQNSAAAGDALLLAKPADFSKIIKTENTTQSIIITDLTNSRKFVFVRKLYNFGGFAAGVCFGGSELTVKVQ